MGPLTSAGAALAAGEPPADRPPAPHAPTPRALDALSAHLMGCGSGEDAAFAELYDALAPRIYGLVLRILRDAHQSEEVTQEVFLQVWQSSSRFDPQRGSALSWVMTMAHRRAVDRVRASEAWHRRDDADAVLSRQTPTDLTSEAVHASLEAESIRAGLATLSLVQRRAIELAYFGGHTHREVAGLLQIPLGTAKARIRDGLIQLRDVMSPATTEQS